MWKRRKKRLYGLDTYSRFVEVEGERYQIEPWLFWRPYTPVTIWRHTRARVAIVRWYWGTRYQRDLWNK